MARLIFPVLVALVFTWSCEGSSEPEGSATPDVTDAVTPDAGDAEADGPSGDAEADTDGPSPRADLAWPVGEDGPYQAGHRTVEFTYDPVSTGEPRTLTLHLWYPTEATTGDDVAYLEIFFDEGVLGNAPLAPPAVGDSYPLHVHSHGDRGYAGSSPYVMRHFATHGWVVAAPDHRGNTIIDNIDPRPSWMYTVRLEDISATIDHLGELPSEDPLSGTLDTSQVVLSGHSYGAYTTLGLSGAAFDMGHIPSVCAADPSGECTPEVLGLFEAGMFESRVVASIPMAPGNDVMYGAEGVGAVQIPTLHMTGSEDRPEANENIWSWLPAPAFRVHVAGGCHQLFALGGCDLITDEVGLPIINAYALAFSRRQLLGDEGVTGLMSGAEVFDAAVTLSTK